MVNTYPDLGNAVCIVAPHTAIKDFFIGLAFSSSNTVAAS